MSAWSTAPVIYELNTAAWLHDVGTRAGAAATLATVPDHEWDLVTPAGVDAVWLMGVWERSPAGVRLALDTPEQVASFRATLPDLTDDDVIGSAYCIRRYEVDDRFGGRAGLAVARAALAARGVKLLVDFVPNHVAPDHPWLVEHPDRFVQGSADDLAADPAAFLAVGEAIVARGRDPYFAPWPDVAQLNAFSPSLRQAAIDTLVDIAGQADGVRCDMAMLMVNRVFAQTWGGRAGDPPSTEYWSDVIGAVRAADADFLFIAEAYWDMEWDLQQLGFDHCYDKRLYDRMLHDGAEAVRGHLHADLDYQRGLLRFIENHDEPRAAGEMVRAQEIAGSVMIATLPGATLWHEGQFEGWKVRLPVFLGRRPVEPSDDALRALHLRLIAAAPEVRRGAWALCDATGWAGDDSAGHLVTWCWTDGAQRSLVVVNLADATAAARVHVPWDDLAGRTWRLDDRVSGESFERDGDEMAAQGLYVGLEPWGVNVFAVSDATVPVASPTHGRAARTRVPRSSHGDWQPAADRPDPVAVLQAGNVDRLANLVPIRFGRMAATPFAFYRGAAALMAADLAGLPTEGSIVQACGDAHLMNFGIFATPERNVVFGMNDFDETLPGPWEWDVKRLAASIVLAGRDVGISDAESEQAAVACVAAYRRRMAELATTGPLDTWYDRIDVAQAVADAPDRAARATRKKLEERARKRVGDSLVPKLVERVGGQLRIADEPPLLYHDDREAMMVAAVDFLARYRASLAADRQVLFDRYQLEDVAIKVVGVGSVGTRCLVALMSVDGQHPLFLQVKEARPSVLEAHLGAGAIDHAGERVVVGQRLLQPASDIFLGWSTGPQGRAFYVRQLRDMKLSITLAKGPGLQQYAEYCARSLARGHANTGDAATISAYLGSTTRFDTAIGRFATAYADQTVLDHARLLEAIRDGEVDAVDEAPDAG